MTTVSATKPRTATGRAPGWAVTASLSLSLVALAVASYLTVTHYADPSSLACPDSGVVNCTLVTTSPESMLLGIPVAVLGLAWAVGMVMLCTPWAWYARTAWVDRVRLVGSAAGAVFVIYLVYAELFRIGAICLWCTAIHVSTVALFAVVLAARAPDRAPGSGLTGRR
jgi:uncharacterized membrane protein